MANPEIDLNKADPTMTERLHQMKPIGVIIGYGILATMVVPLLALKQMPVADFCILLAFLIGFGLIGASLWGIWTLYTRNPATETPVPDRKRHAGIYLLTGFGVAIMMFGATWFLTWAFSNNWVSYTILKSGGLLTYILFGGIPVVMYILSLYAVANRKIFSSFNWMFSLALFLLPLSIWTQVFWVGFKVYSDYHVI